MVKQQFDRLIRKIDSLEEKIDSVIPRQHIINGRPMWDNTAICKMFGISKRTLQRYRSKKILPYHPHEGVIYYDVEEVNEVIDKILQNRG